MDKVENKIKKLFIRLLIQATRQTGLIHPVPNTLTAMIDQHEK